MIGDWLGVKFIIIISETIVIYEEWYNMKFYLLPSNNNSFSLLTD